MLCVPTVLIPKQELVSFVTMKTIATGGIPELGLALKGILMTSLPVETWLNTNQIMETHTLIQWAIFLSSDTFNQKFKILEVYISELVSTKSQEKWLLDCGLAENFVDWRATYKLNFLPMYQNNKMNRISI